MEQPQNIPPEETIDLKRYFFLFLSNWYWIAIAVFMSLFVSYLVNRYSEKVYSVNSSILIGGAEGRRYGQGVQMLMREMNILQQAKRIENEMGILKTYSLARMTIEELPDFWITYVAVGRRGIAESKMYTNSPFVVIPDSGFENPTGYPVHITVVSPQEYQLELNGESTSVKTLRFGQPYVGNRFAFTIVPRDSLSITQLQFPKRYYFTFNSPHTLALSYMGKLGVELNDEQGSILTLTSSGYVASQEADYLNKLVEIYNRNDLESKSQTAINTLSFLEAQISGISDSLRQAELMLQNFRAGRGIIDLSTEGRAMLERLERLHSDRNLLSLQVEYFKYMESYLKEKKDVMELVSPASIGIEESSIAQIVQQLNQQQLERNALLLSVSADNMQVVRLNQSIASLRALLFEKITGMREVNRIRISEINRRIAEQEANLRMLPVTERELLNMERKFNIHEKFYTYLMEKRIEAGIAKASNVSDNRILDAARADMATPVKPNRRMNYLIGLLVGVLLPSALILLFDQLNNSIQDPSIINRLTNVPLIGTIGNNPFESFLPIYHKPKSAFAESFRALRTNLDFYLGDSCNGVVLVSSTVSNEGKSFIASNLSVSLAMLGKRTVLLGLDLRKPKVHSIFGVDNSRGISTYLIGRDTIADIINPTDMEGLSVIPAGPIPPNPAELIASTRLDQLIETLRKDYDYIVIDSPPVAVVTDAVLVSRLSCVTLFVIRHRYTSRNVLNLVENLSKTKAITNMALILNDYKSTPGYGYNYSLNYGYNYGYKYGYNYGNSKGYYTEDEGNGSIKSFLKGFFGKKA